MRMSSGDQQVCNCREGQSSTEHVTVLFSHSSRNSVGNQPQKESVQPSHVGYVQVVCLRTVCGFDTFLGISVATHVTARGVRVI